MCPEMIATLGVMSPAILALTALWADHRDTPLTGGRGGGAVTRYQEWTRDKG